MLVDGRVRAHKQGSHRAPPRSVLAPGRLAARAAERAPRRQDIAPRRLHPRCTSYPRRASFIP
jgi:hypothetical protein